MTRKVFSYSNENVSVKLVISLKEEVGESAATESAKPVIATRLLA